MQATANCLTYEAGEQGSVGDVNILKSVSPEEKELLNSSSIVDVRATRGFND